jgi:hypothetical protein
VGRRVVTDKLPERNGERYYRIRHTGEVYERVVREAELTAIADNNGAPAGKGRAKR